MKEKFRYKKEMGQHFILDPTLVETLADASAVTRADGVLEIGPGRGLLTAALARRARKVLAVEIDRTLIADLKTSMALYPNVEIVQGDILRQDLHALVAKLGTPCRAAANLPYNITTPLLEKMLHARLPFVSIALMVQREVAARMLAQPGTDGYGPLAILVAFYTTARSVLDIPAACFTPPPKVDSSFVLLTMRSEPAVSVPSEAAFFRTVRIAFAMRRKTILNNLLAGAHLARDPAIAVLDTCGIDPRTRAEQLDLHALAKLSAALYAMAASPMVPPPDHST